MATFILGPFNTVSLATGTVMRLKGAVGVNRHIDVLNLGPGNVFLRADQDPVVGDSFSLLLPANYALNDIAVDGTIGLGVIADAASKLSVNVK